jgi:hypothetical protein
MSEFYRSERLLGGGAITTQSHVLLLVRGRGKQQQSHFIVAGTQLHAGPLQLASLHATFRQEGYPRWQSSTSLNQSSKMNPPSAFYSNPIVVSRYQSSHVNLADAITIIRI